jgi:phosphatidate cytidylyltransferase
MAMLRWRLLLGAVFIGALVGLCWLDVHQALGAPPGAWLFPLALLLSLGASGEMLELVGRSDEKPIGWIVCVGNLAIVASNGVSLAWPSSFGSASPIERLGWPLITLTISMLVAFCGEMARYAVPGRVVVRIGLSALSFIYVGVLLSFVVQLRLVGSNLTGMTALVSLIAVVKMGDSGAYTVGRMFGRHKMAPVLSPGKTWEGVAGAIVFAMLGAWIVFRAFPGAAGVYTFLRWEWLIYGAVVGIAGLIGDLAESIIKRDAGRKDSSAWMPGFGGILDVLDSILLAAPIAWILWMSGLV